jgi:BASS family bile acid:Na+ symporter
LFLEKLRNLHTLSSDFYSVILLPAALALLMIGMGLSLTMSDFRNIMVYPRSLLLGLFCQMLLLPAFAFAIAYFANLPPELKVGIVIIAVCPGGATSNLITYLLRGNVALAVSLTTVNSILTIFTIPMLTYVALFWIMGMGQTIKLPLALTVVKIFLITLLPVSIGVTIRYFRQDFARRIDKHLRYILPLLYGIIFVIAILGSKREHPDHLTDLYFQVVPWVLALNLGAMLTGFLLSRLLRRKVEDQITLTVEIGIQNTALAITVAGSSLFLNNYMMAIPAVVYGLLTFATAIIFGFLIKRYSA